MKVGIMQPYFFPYLGYFQLVNCVDNFVFYDDVTYIKGGYINRNRILVNGQPKFITVPLVAASSYKKINDTKISVTQRDVSKTLKLIRQNYGKCEFFSDVYPLVETVLLSANKDIAKLASMSVRVVSTYLSLATCFHSSSEIDYGQFELDRTQRILEITKGLGGSTYINASGGKSLYNKEDFRREGITLHFISNSFPEYNQRSNIFIPGLSIIDVLMNNSKSEVLQMLDDYTLH